MAVNYKTKGLTPLMLACIQPHFDVIRLFLNPEEINKKTPTGETALSIALSLGHTEVVQLLLDHGAKPTMCKSRLFAGSGDEKSAPETPSNSLSIKVF